MPELRSLRVFVAVAEQLSFTRAAEQLHLTQQTVSKTIGDLERELGVTLLERTSREVHLTAAGEALLGPARDTLAQAAAAFAAARSVGAGLAGTVRVGVSPAIGPDDRANIVHALRTETERSVSIHELRPGELAASLRDRVVDVVVASITGTGGDAIERAPLADGRMQIHVTERLAHVTSIDQLDGERLLCANPAGTPYTDLLVARFAAGGAAVTPIEARVTGGSQLLTELTYTNAIAAMPSGSPPPPGVRRLDLEAFGMPRVVLWPAGRRPQAVDDLVAYANR